MINTYSTRPEAIEAEVIAPLGEWAEEHDIEAIADEVLAWSAKRGFWCHADVDEFWTIVEMYRIEK